MDKGNLRVLFADSNAEDRRRFLGLCLGAAVALAAREAHAAELPHLEPGDLTASALGYVEDASTVDEEKAPQHKPGQSCGNCRQYTKVPDSAYGPCVIFTGKSVNEKGWCGAYVAKA